MNISFTPELEKYVNRQVESGFYHSSSEVIRAALRLIGQI
ncbi:type II toxin-antitoxin system ParD family antitoxin [Candidatus Rickettsia kedanie]